MKKLLLALTAMTLSATLAYAKGGATPPAKSGDKVELKKEVKQHREEVKEACAADTATAGCAAKEGREKIKCMREYKKSHADFKVSEACKSSLKEGKEARNELKELGKKRKAKKDAKDTKDEDKDTK